MRRALFVGVIALTVTGCATMQAGKTRSVEQMLAAAGFHMKVADTPETAADLRALPPRKMTVQRRGAEPYYVYGRPRRLQLPLRGHRAAVPGVPAAPPAEGAR